MRLSTLPRQFLAAMSNFQPPNRWRGWGRGTTWNRIGSSSSFTNSSGGYVPGDFQSIDGENDSQREKEQNDGYQNRTPSTAFRTPRNYYGQNPQLGFSRDRVFRPRESDYRVWDYSKIPPPPDAERFIVLSYNILADSLGNEHREKLYRHIPRYMMDWEWRKRSILFELGLWSPDIMCLQEVDRFEDLYEGLKQRGYNGVWKVRTGNCVDGCAVFWRTSRFNMIQEESIEYCNLGMRDNVAQVCVLELIENRNNPSSPTSSSNAGKIVVCNIHVLYNPKRGDIKLGQVRLLIEKARAISRRWNNAPLVICGDFNSTPKSALYNFIAEQKLRIGEVGRDKISGQASATINYSINGFGASETGYPVFPKPDRLISFSDKLGNPLQYRETNESSTSLESTADTSKLSCKNRDTKMFNLSIHPEQFGSALHPNEQTQNDASSLSCESAPHHYLKGITEKKSTSSPVDATKIEGPESSHNLNEATDIPSEGRHFSANTQSIYGSGLETETHVYNPYFWTPEEINTATGDPQCTLMEHQLLLTSTYTEVEYKKDASRTRDGNGEPLATSCNRCFLGTVDYIWRSEGLQTIKVLAPLSKQFLQQSGGFPTKKWGSDHIALVSQLALVPSST